LNIKIVPFNIIERVPVYSGCDEQLSNEKLKKCMSAKISSFVLKTFDTRMASYLKPSVTDVRITVLFKIDEHGNMGNIIARGPHPKLEQEAIRVVEALPDLTKPGMQDGKPAIVPYMLPIRFAIEKPSKNQRIQN
tara:strand:+ start:230 stop:634 length:405 start_codon:yes stop_codon:yes gene_type:complete